MIFTCRYVQVEVAVAHVTIANHSDRQVLHAGAHLLYKLVHVVGRQAQIILVHCACMATVKMTVGQHCEPHNVLALCRAVYKCRVYILLWMYKQSCVI